MATTPKISMKMGAERTCADNPENPLCGSSDTNMQGKSIEFGYSRIGGWPPSSAPEAMWPAFQSYAKEDVRLRRKRSGVRRSTLR